MEIEGRDSIPAPGAFSPDGNLLAFTYTHRAVILMRTGSWEEVTKLPINPNQRFDALTFTPDGNRLMAVSQTGVHIWDVGRIRAKWRELGVDVE